MVRPGVIVGSTVQAVADAGTSSTTCTPWSRSRRRCLFVHRVLLAGGFAMLVLLGVVTWIVARQTVTPGATRGATSRSASPTGTSPSGCRCAGEDELASLARSSTRWPRASRPDPALEELSAMQRRSSPTCRTSCAPRSPPSGWRARSSTSPATRFDPDAPARPSCCRPDRPVRVPAGRPAGDQPVRRRRRGPRRRAPRPARPGHVGRRAGRPARGAQGRAVSVGCPDGRCIGRLRPPPDRAHPAQPRWSTRSSTPRSGRSR